MILAWAVIIGFIAGLARAIIGKRPYQTPHVRHIWLVIIAFIPQFIAFRLPQTRTIFPDYWVPVVLLGTQAILLVFIALNIKEPGFWAIGMGLAANFLVILLNQGMMPISPETVRTLEGQSYNPVEMLSGKRYGIGKDIILDQGAMRLWFLSDLFILPISQTLRVAFSMGDILIAFGVFWLLWSMGGTNTVRKEQYA
jgi:hypothetical protein